jgi:hypothetical protein
MPSHRLQRTSRLTTLLGVGLQLWGWLAGIENLTASSFFPPQPSHEQRTEQPPPSNIVTASSPWPKLSRLPSRRPQTQRKRRNGQRSHTNLRLQQERLPTYLKAFNREAIRLVSCSFRTNPPQPHIRTTLLVLKRALKARRRRAEDIGVDFTRSRPRNHHTYVPT